MTEQLLTYSCIAVIMWLDASDLLELIGGVLGAWALMTAILWLVPQ
jgi:hypothetical protein